MGAEPRTWPPVSPGSSRSSHRGQESTLGAVACSGSTPPSGSRPSTPGSRPAQGRRSGCPTMRPSAMLGCWERGRSCCRPRRGPEDLPRWGRACRTDWPSPRLRVTRLARESRLTSNREWVRQSQAMNAMLRGPPSSATFVLPDVLVRVEGDHIAAVTALTGGIEPPPGAGGGRGRDGDDAAGIRRHALPRGRRRGLHRPRRRGSRPRRRAPPRARHVGRARQPRDDGARATSSGASRC